MSSAGLELYNQLKRQKTRLTTIASQQSTANAQLSAYGKLQSAMTSLQTATAALGKATTWNSTSVGSTNTAFTATTTADASVGSFVVNVNRGCKRHRRSQRILCKQHGLLGDTTGTTRKITITQPGTKTPLEVTWPMVIRRWPGSRAPLTKRTAASPPALAMKTVITA